MAITGFGKPSFGYGPRYKSWYVKEGNNIYRVLPPMKACANDGIWQMYMRTHFGYYGVNTFDPSRPKIRTFKCIQDFDYKTKEIKAHCPECDSIAKQRNSLESMQNALAAKKATQEEIDSATGPLTGWLRSHNCDSKTHLFAMNEAGEFGELKINTKFHKKGFEARHSELQKVHGIDSMDPNQGCWINFKRTGKGMNTVDTVEIVFDMIDTGGGRKAQVPKLAPLTQEQADAALAILPDLTSLGGTLLNYAQIDMLVNCSGDPKDVDHIFSLAQPNTVAPAPIVVRTPAPIPAPVTIPVTTPTVVPIAVTAKPAVDTAKQKILADLQAKRAAAAVVAAKVAAELEAEEAATIAAMEEMGALEEAPVEEVPTITPVITTVSPKSADDELLEFLNS